jgi:hypothetical protein
MAKFIPIRHKKFIVFISYSYKSHALQSGVFLTKVVSLNADKCHYNSQRPGGKQSWEAWRLEAWKLIRRLALLNISAEISKADLTGVPQIKNRGAPAIWGFHPGQLTIGSVELTICIPASANF